jgi:hypothetical protein
VPLAAAAPAAGAAAAVVAAGAAGAAAVGAAAAGAGAAPAGVALAALFTPPWPLQAPRPLLEDIVPSLQTVAAPAVELAAAAAGAAAGVDAAAGAADPAGVALAALFTPPWPLHAPRPLLAEVVPSLQTVLAAPEELAAAGAAAAGADEDEEPELLPELAAAVAVLSMPP